VAGTAVVVIVNTLLPPLGRVVARRPDTGSETQAEPEGALGDALDGGAHGGVPGAALDGKGER